MSGNKGRNNPSRKGHLSTGEFFALGSKSGPSKPSLRHAEEAKQTSTKPGAGPPPPKKLRPAPPTETSSSGGLFSDPIRMTQVQSSHSSSSKGQSTLGIITKGQSTAPSLKGQSGSAKPGSHSSSLLSLPVIEVRPGELVSAVTDAKSSGDDTKVVRILAGAMKQLKHSRLKPDPKLNNDLITLVKSDPQLFNHPNIIEGLVAVLKREPSVIFKARSNPSVYVLATQILVLALQHSYDWPEMIGKVFIEDSVGDRVWVDLEQCKKLVDNICLTFQTKQSTSAQSSGEGTSGAKSSAGDPTGSSSSTAGGGGGGGGGEDNGGLVLTDVDVEPRFSRATCNSLKAHILQLISDAFSRHAHPPDTVSRNLLRFLSSVAGYSDVRVSVAQKMESWIQNPKLGKHCQELLMAVATNCTSHEADDLKVIESLLAIRLKTKLFSNQFVACIRELISSHPNNLETVLRGVVNNELGQLRSPSNIALLAMMMHSWPDEAPKLLGGVFQEFLTRKEDYLRALRGFLREIVRQVRNEFNFYSFAWSLMQKRDLPELQQMEPQHKERMALSLADLIACSCMLMANMLIREAYNGYQKGEKAMISQLQEFFNTLGVIQRDAVWWIHTIVAEIYRPQPQDYKLCLRKVLFLEEPEVYCSKDNWPPETDRKLILHMMSEASLKEDTLMRVLVIGLKRELPLSPADSLDIADRLVARAASAHTDEIPRLPTVERRELFNVIFDITAYRPPPNIQLPEDYQPPSLAISKLYWKGWILLLVLSAFNPTTIGSLGWSEYPSLKGMMEMVMTSNYSFPPSMALAVHDDGSVESRDSAIMREMQVSRTEKETILEYENHLAASSPQPNVITEANSYLLNQVTLLQPKGPVRRLPGTVIELIKTVNRLKLGQLLCRCRSPDFLLDIIRRQGTVESMKWLTELMESSHSSLEVLPVPCLCEFLMASYKEQRGNGSSEIEADPSSHRAHYKRRKTHDKVHERQKQLVCQLHSLLVGPQATAEKTSEVLEYFFDKLTGSNLTPRRLALKSLRYILSRGVPGQPESDISDAEDDDGRLVDGKEDEWLMQHLPSLPHFNTILPKVSHLLLQACLVETNLKHLLAFILFITSHIPRDLTFEFSIGISQIVVDRFGIIKKVFKPHMLSSEERGQGMGVGREAMLASLLAMLRVSLEMAIQSKRMPQVSGSCDFVVVGFPSGKKTILHTALIHATLLLLTCPPPSQRSDFDFLMQSWFPEGGEFPEAYTVEDKVETPIISRAILPEMLCSQNAQVLGLCLRDAGNAELCTSVQQFGIPRANIQRILSHLDGLCESEPTTALEEVVKKNPSKLAQFTEIQIMRGGPSGRKFLSFVRNLADLPDDPVLSVSDMLAEGETQEVEMTPVSPSTLGKSDLLQISNEEAEQVLMKIFAPSVSRSSLPAEEVSKLTSNIEQCLKRVVQSAATSASDGDREQVVANACVNAVITALHKIVVQGTGRMRRQVVEGMVKHTFATSLLRLLTRIHQLQGHKDTSTELFVATVKQISDCLATLKVGKLKQLPRFQAALKSCAKHLGLKAPPDRESYSEKVSKVVQDCTSGIREERNLFSGEHAGMISDICRFVGMEKQSPLVEDVLSALVQRSIISGMEGKCIDLLQRLDWRCRPITVHHCPEVFQDVQWVSKSESQEGRGGEGTQVSTSHPTFVHSLDMSGLKVDFLELLDPEVLHVTPEVTRREVFGWSVTEEKNNETGTYLGPGYLMARLVHESSWQTLHQVISSLLEKDCLNEGINANAVLDFLWACLHKPVLWQGCVRKEAVENSNLSMGIDESELTLTPSQLNCLLDYMLTEASAANTVQLPLLGWLLRGRAHLNSSEFRNRNHKHVFQNSLFLLHLLQPIVFHDSQGPAVENCLQPFFDFLQNQCIESKKHQNTVLKFSDFLVLYTQHNKKRAAPLIYLHLNLLKLLADNYTTKKSSLRSLVECFPKQLEGPSLTTPTTAGTPLGVQIMVVPPSISGHSLTHEQVMPFLKKLEQGQLREDVLKVLQDLEETSLHSVEILKHFVPELCRIIHDPEPTSCNLAHNLLLRHIKETPSSIETLLSAYTSCLESHDYSVVMATARAVPDLVLLCPAQSAHHLLRRLFQLATHSFINCTPELLQAVDACTRHVFQ